MRLYLKIKYVKNIIANPVGFLRILRALLRGIYYIIFYRIKSKKYKLMFPLFAFCKLQITGPGHVQIGRGCKIFKNIYDGLIIMTCNDKAKVVIGDYCNLGGLTIRCDKKIIIGYSVMSANAIIQDMLFSSIHNHCKNSDIRKKIQAKSIIVGNNVWIGQSAIILSGCRIGNDSVISPGSLCSDIVVPVYSIAMGNPAIRFYPIDRYLEFLKKR